MQNSYEIHDSQWSEERRRRPQSPARSLAPKPPRFAYGWTPTVANSGWKDVSKSSGAFLDSGASSFKFILLCGLWYTSSALSSNTGKSIMLIFKYPVTLTIVQFAFIAGYCLLLASPVLQFAKLRRPTAAILHSTIPMAAFQVGGHMSSSMAISRIPVSTVHTIKALSPLFTVAAYAMLFGVKYSPLTYISLLPLTIGVMLACTFDMSASNFFGLLCAFGSAIIFVSSNIFFKKIMPTGSTNHANKLDKINLLFYSSGIAFLMMIPVWFYYDLIPLMNRWSAGSVIAANRHVDPSNHSVGFYFLANGTVHFLQNVIAFALLATTSPVTYSIASLIKRIAVICIAIVWFNQSIHPVQGLGILLTFGGLWLYNMAKSDVERGEKIARRVEVMREMVLPSTKEEVDLFNSTTTAEQTRSETYPVRVSIAPPLHAPRPSVPQQRMAHHKHSRTFSRDNPPPPLDTTLAAKSYNKAQYVFSPPQDQAGVDPYPSPPKSPPDVGQNQNGNGYLALNNNKTINRRNTMQNVHTESIAVR